MPAHDQVLDGYRPSRARVLFAEPRHRWMPGDAGEECRHDGECVATATECLPWIHLSGTYAAATPAVLFLRRVWCGCVESRCQWFEQELEDGGVQWAPSTLARLRAGERPPP